MWWPMRIIWTLLFLFCAGAAGAVPSPAPPPEYTGDQYIDGEGCVFNRKNSRWEARRDREGKAVCGFPPTLSARRIDPDADILPSMRPQPNLPGPEQILREQLATGLRQGEFLADPREVEERHEPEIAKTDAALTEGVRKMLHLKVEVDAKLAGNPGDPGLCARLGYRPDLNPRPRLGSDVTLGICPGQRPSGLPQRIELAAAQDDRLKKTEEAASGERQASPARKPARHVQRKVVASAPTTAGSGTETPRKNTKSVPVADTIRPEMIPASARYVQVGVFADDASAEPAIRGLRGLGYPVARGNRHDPDRKSRVILAGPFDDRRTLVAALTLLRGKGYNAVAH